MKKVKVLISVLLVMLLIGCGNPGDQADICTETNKEIGTTEAVTEEVIIEETTTKETVKNDLEILLEFGMLDVFASDLGFDYQKHYIMALGNVGVRAVPAESVEPFEDLNYEFVRVYAAAYEDKDEKWVLVGYDPFDGGSRMGWVKSSDLAEYTEDMKDKLLFPVNVSDDCKDIDTGEAVEQDDWKITSIEGDCVDIVRVGGRSNRVKLKDIVYPDTDKLE